MAYYCGAEGVELVSHGEWSDPELVWEGLSFNYWDIEDALWGMFCLDKAEDSGLSVMEIDSKADEYEDEYCEFVRDNIDWYLQEVVAGGYFD